MDSRMIGAKLAVKFVNTIRKKGGKVSEGGKSRVTEDISRLKKITLPDYVVI